MSTTCYIIYYILFLIAANLALKGCEDSEDDWHSEDDSDMETRNIICLKGPVPPEVYNDVTAIEVNRGELPYMVYFKNPKGKTTGGFLGAGSMIHKKAAITACSCFESLGDKELLWLQIISDVNYEIASGFRKSRRIKGVIAHPNYTADLRECDICVVLIYTAFTFTTEINQIALPKPQLEGENCIFASWGTVIAKLKNNPKSQAYPLPKLYQMSLAVSQCPKDKSELCAAGDIKVPYVEVLGGILACNDTLMGIAIGGHLNLTQAEGDVIAFTDVTTHRRHIRRILMSMRKPKFSCCSHKQIFFYLILISVLSCLVL